MWLVPHAGGACDAGGDFASQKFEEYKVEWGRKCLILVSVELYGCFVYIDVGTDVCVCCRAQLLPPPPAKAKGV